MWLKHNQTDYKNTKQSGFKDENQCWKKKKKKKKKKRIVFPGSQAVSK
jgi:hypothetical protein